MTTQNEIEYAKCDACGGYHPIDDCEVVVIKMLKGKNCVFDSSPIKNTTKVVIPPNVYDTGNKIAPIPQPTFQKQRVEKQTTSGWVRTKQHEITEIDSPKLRDNEGNLVEPSPEIKRVSGIPKTPVPPGLRTMMQPPAGQEIH